MSSEALAWAFQQDICSSSVKFTLVALCECANFKTGAIFPSIEHLSEITGQNRKTIIGNIAVLEEMGCIVDTGERAGKTKQIKVYSVVFGTVPKTERYQKRNSTVFTRKESQKRDTEPSREPSSNHSNARARSIPDDWAPREFGKNTKSRAVVDGWSADYLTEQIEHFTANHRGKGSKFVDWQDAWSTWVLRNRRFGNGDGIRRSGGQGADKRSGLARAIDNELKRVSSFP